MYRIFYISDMTVRDFIYVFGRERCGYCSLVSVVSVHRSSLRQDLDEFYFRTGAGASNTRLQKCLIFLVTSHKECQTASELIYGLSWPLLCQIIRQERCSLLVVLLRASVKWLSASACGGQRLNCGWFFLIQTGQMYCTDETILFLFMIWSFFCTKF